MKQYFFMLLAAMLLSCGSVFAQSENNESIKGDVNGDGRVDIVDVTTVIDIYLNTVPDAPQTTTYYWYVGSSNPMDMTNISPIVTDNTSPGWRKIEDDLSTYGPSKMLWNGAENGISFGGRTEYYVALPNDSLKLYNVLGNSEMDGCTSLGTKVINGITYYVYKRNVKAMGFAFNIY